MINPDTSLDRILNDILKKGIEAEELETKK